MFALIAFLALQAPDDLSGQRVVDLFAPFEYRVAGGLYADRVFKYRLFVPELSHHGAQLPLIIWMHGEGESGDDNVAHLRWLGLIFTDKTDRTRYPYFVLAVQKPANEPWAMTKDGASDPGDMLAVTMSIADVVIREFPVDPDRIYVSGVSSGGTATWELGIRHPDRFAAIAPLASAGTDPQRARRLVGVPIRAFHSTYDSGTPVHSVRGTVDAINAAGGDASLVEVESNRHDCWTAAFQEHRLLDWLLLQKRGSLRRDLAGEGFLRAITDVAAGYWVVILIPVMLVLAWRLEKRRRLRMELASDPVISDRA